MTRASWASCWVVTVACWGAAACAPTDDGGISSNRARNVYATWNRLGRVVLEDAYTSAQAVDVAVDGLLDAPSDGTLLAARDAWLDARGPWSTAQILHAEGSPLDTPGEEGAPTPSTLLGLWAFDPADVDYVSDGGGGVTLGGFVNDPGTYGPVDVENLLALHQAGGDASAVTVGWTVAELLLWGEDLDINAPGARGAGDYTVGVGVGDVARRRAYVDVVSDLLVRHTGVALGGWDDYGEAFEDRTVEDGLSSLVGSMRDLVRGDLLDRRLLPALATGLGGDATSPFADNSSEEFRAAARGLRMAWDGRYIRTSGEVIDGGGVGTIVGDVDDALAKRVTEEVDAVVVSAAALELFDKDITTPAGQDRINALIASLEAVEVSLDDVAAALGVSAP
jgi:putative iron-regulated protein